MVSWPRKPRNYYSQCKKSRWGEKQYGRRHRGCLMKWDMSAIEQTHCSSADKEKEMGFLTGSCFQPVLKSPFCSLFQVWGAAVVVTSLPASSAEHRSICYLSLVLTSVVCNSRGLCTDARLLWGSAAPFKSMLHSCTPAEELFLIFSPIQIDVGRPLAQKRQVSRFTWVTGFFELHWKSKFLVSTSTTRVQNGLCVRKFSLALRPTLGVSDLGRQTEAYINVPGCKKLVKQCPLLLSLHKGQ